MKSFFSPPATEAGQQFYTRYASLIPAMLKSGYLAQIVSGLTEWGILYAVIFSSLAAFWPEQAATAGIIGASVGVATLEGGLRKLLPYSARAVILKRWRGLDGWITGIVLTTTALLLATSGYLSFAGSGSLVNEMATPPPAATATATDSLATAEGAILTAQHDADVAAIRSTYEVRLDAVKKSAGATLRRLDGQMETLRTRERTTGQKFITRAAELTEQKADAIADREAELAALATDREAELATLRTAYRGRLDNLTAARDSTRHQVATSNASALQQHQDKVGKYGGGLAWFTVVCLLILIVSVILDELHKAGAGITEQIEPDAYTFEGSAVAAFIEAVAARGRRFAFGLVHHIERGTPEAPEPVAAPIIWQRGDALKLTTADKGVERRVKHLRPLKRAWWRTEAPAAQTEPARQKIGFTPNSTTEKPAPPLTQLHTPPATQETENDSTSSPSPAFIQSRLNMYRQRLGNAQQRATVQQRKKGSVNPKTAAAIENNRQHVQHYEGILNALKGAE